MVMEKEDRYSIILYGSNLVVREYIKDTKRTDDYACSTKAGIFIAVKYTYPGFYVDRLFGRFRKNFSNSFLDDVDGLSLLGCL